MSSLGDSGERYLSREREDDPFREIKERIIPYEEIKERIIPYEKSFKERIISYEEKEIQLQVLSPEAMRRALEIMEMVMEKTGEPDKKGE